MESEEKPKVIRLKPVELSKGEAYGMSALEIKIGNDYIASNPDVSVSDISPVDSSRMSQLIALGATLTEIGLSFPKYDLGLIIVVAARSGWVRLKERNRGSIQSDIQTKILKASLDSMEFLTSMISATSQKYAREFREYMADPDNQEFPDLKVSNIKDFKDSLETMQKMVVFTVQAGTDEMKREKTDMDIKKLKPPKKNLLDQGASRPPMTVSEVLAEEKRLKGEMSTDVPPRGRDAIPIESTIDTSNEVGPEIQDWDLVKMPSIDLGDAEDGASET